MKYAEKIDLGDGKNGWFIGLGNLEKIVSEILEQQRQKKQIREMLMKKHERTLRNLANR
jgi:hypothetical protein